MLFRVADEAVCVAAEAVCVAGRSCWAGLLRRGSRTSARLLCRGLCTAAGLQPLCGASSSEKTLIVGDLQSYSIIRYNILSTTPKGSDEKDAYGEKCEKIDTLKDQ